MLDLFESVFWVVPASTFVAGMVGSPHCASMCGPVVLCFSKSRAQLVSYQVGRLISYASVGAVAGAMGKSVLGESRPVWINWFGVISIAALLIFHGYRTLSNKPIHFPTPRWLSAASSKIWQILRIQSLPKSAAAGLAGVFTVMLPCGHLYTFLLGAVATGSAVRGAIFMSAFWLGSAPLLSFGGHWLQRLLQPKIAGGRRWAGVILLAAGLVSVAAFGAKTEEFVKSINARSSGADKPASEAAQAASVHHCH